MKYLCLLLFSLIGVLGIEHDFKGFDDSILFGIEWPGPLDNLQISDEDWISKVFHLQCFFSSSWH